MIAICSRRFSAWLSIQLAHGKLPGGSGRLFSEEAATEMWTPQTLMPLEQRPPALAVTAPQFQSYALGWEVRDYRGHKIVWHAGADTGFGAVVVLIPEKNTGFAIMANAVDGLPIKGLMYELLDHYLGYPKTDWPKVLAVVKQGQVEAALKAMKAQAPSQAAAKVGPLLPLGGYAGDYADPWYGPISIALKDGKLFIDFKQSPGMVGELEHVQYETFRTRWTDKGTEPAYVTFSLTPEGKVDRIAMKPVSPLADFSFDYQDLEFRPLPPKT